MCGLQDWSLVLEYQGPHSGLGTTSTIGTSWPNASVAMVEAIAIITDSDDTGGAAAAFYGDIYF